MSAVGSPGSSLPGNLRSNSILVLMEIILTKNTILKYMHCWAGQLLNETKILPQDGWNNLEKASGCYISYLIEIYRI